MVGDSTLAGAGDQSAVFAEDSGAVSRSRLCPGSPTTFEFRVVHVQLQQQLVGIHGDAVAFLHQADGSTDGGFGGHMANHEAIGAAAEAAIGDQCHLLAEALAHDGGCRGEHLAHAGTPHGALVAHHHHIARLDLAIENGRQAGFLTLKHPGRACQHR